MNDETFEALTAKWNTLKQDQVHWGN
jgi:hypothetical protein